MAVDRDDDVAQPGHELVEAVEVGGVLGRHRVADGVGDVDRRRALLDGDRAHLGRELDVGAGGVHGGELDVVAVPLCVGDRGAGLALDVLAGGLQLVADVDVRRRDEGVDARPGGVADRVPGRVDVLDVGARQTGHNRAFDLPGDRLYGLEVAGARDREAGLDDVDAQAGELVGDLELLGRVERDAGRLLAVAQRGVEDQYSVGVHACLLLRRIFSGLCLRLRGRHALFPPKGEEKKAKVKQARHLLRSVAAASWRRAKRAGRGVLPPAPVQRQRRRRWGSGRPGEPFGPCVVDKCRPATPMNHRPGKSVNQVSSCDT